LRLQWEASRIVVIDQDLGQSGASVVDRLGFQHLVAEVGLGHVGLVMGLEVSRLARSSLDWHHLLEICTLTGTLILDEDGLYDPDTFNDRLLLGLKGTMSEAELHVLKARLRGGILHQAQRGALKVPLPVGLVYAEDDTVILDPNAQVQQAIHLLFATFKRTGSAWGTVKSFRNQGLLFPRRVRTGAHKGEIHWAPLVHNTARHVLRNPRYAGVCWLHWTSVREMSTSRTISSSSTACKHGQTRVQSGVVKICSCSSNDNLLFKGEAFSVDQVLSHLLPLRRTCQNSGYGVMTHGISPHLSDTKATTCSHCPILCSIWQWFPHFV
jgi:DNA invertase Pin-like site-specific DNA recombinase